MSAQSLPGKKRKNNNDLRTRNNLRKDLIFLSQPDYLFVRANGKYVRVNFSELICIRGKRGYIQIVTESGSLITMNNLNEIAGLLPVNLFCRIHHSYIVAVNRIRSFDNEKVYLFGQPEGKTYRSALSTATELPIGAHYRKNLKKSIWFLPSKVGAKSKVVKNAEIFMEEGIE